jgi:hypothetical protein
VFLTLPITDKPVVSGSKTLPNLDPRINGQKGPKTALFGVILGHFGPFWPKNTLFGEFLTSFWPFLDHFWIKVGPKNLRSAKSDEKVMKKHEKTEKTPKEVI